MLIKSDSIKSLAGAFVKCQGEVGTALKDSTNPHFRSRYADLAAVWDAAKEALQANGLAVSQLPSTLEDGSIALTTILIHNSGEYLGATYRLKPQKEDPQGYGSALTYARRYALSALLGIVADEDDDGEAASGRTGKPSPATVAKPKSQAAQQVAESLPVTSSKEIATFDGNNPQHKAIVASCAKKLNWDVAKFGKHYQDFKQYIEERCVEPVEGYVKSTLLQWSKENALVF